MPRVSGELLECLCMNKGASRSRWCPMGMMMDVGTPPSGDIKKQPAQCDIFNGRFRVG